MTGHMSRLANLPDRRPSRRRVRPPRPRPAGHHPDRHARLRDVPRRHPESSPPATSGRSPSPASSARTCRASAARPPSTCTSTTATSKSQDEIQADDRGDAQADRGRTPPSSPSCVAGTRGRGAGRLHRAGADAWSALVDDALRALARRDGRQRRGARRLARPLHGQDQPADRQLADEVVALQAAVSAEHRRDRRRASRRAPRSTSRLLLIVMVVALLLALLIAVVDHAQRRRARCESLMDRLRSPGRALPRRRSPSGLEAAAAGDFTREATPVTDAARGALDRRARPARRRPSTRCSPRPQRSIAAYGAMRGQLGALIGEVSRVGRDRLRRFPAGRVLLRRGRAARSARSPPPSTDVAQGAERQVRMVESTRTAVQEAAAAAASSGAAAAETARGRRRGARRGP